VAKLVWDVPAGGRGEELVGREGAASASQPKEGDGGECGEKAVDEVHHAGWKFVTIYECSDASCSEQTEIMRHKGYLSSSIIFSVMTGFLKMTFKPSDFYRSQGFIASWSVTQTNTCIKCGSGSAAGASVCTNCPAFSSSEQGSMLLPVRILSGVRNLPVSLKTSLVLAKRTEKSLRACH
jgi:hypothetical protein